MSIIKKIGIALFFNILFVANLFACDINFSLVDNKKEAYNVGDELILKVSVVLTHRNCPEGIQATKFSTKGAEIISATNWNETSTGNFERKLKVKITNSDSNKASISATRTCKKEGGFGSISLKVNSK